MGALDLLIHLAGFAAPALFVAVLLAVLCAFLLPKTAAARTTVAQAAINFVAGIAVLAAGLWWFGRDGKMATYAALVVVMGTVQWVLARGWRG
jgi:hypothetical protein